MYEEPFLEDLSVLESAHCNRRQAVYPWTGLCVDQTFEFERCSRSNGPGNEYVRTDKLTAMKALVERLAVKHQMRKLGSHSRVYGMARTNWVGTSKRNSGTASATLGPETSNSICQCLLGISSNDLFSEVLGMKMNEGLARRLATGHRLNPLSSSRSG